MRVPTATDPWKTVDLTSETGSPLPAGRPTQIGTAAFTMAAMDIEDEVKRLGSELEQISAALYNSDYLKQERKQRAVSILGDGSAASETREIAEARNYDRQEKAAFVQERLLTMNEEQRGIYRWALHLCLSQVHGCTCF